MFNFRKRLTLWILLCAFVSAQHAFAQHQVFHNSDHPAVEQCELCSHVSSVKDITFTPTLEWLVTPTNALQHGKVQTVSTNSWLSASNSRAPPVSR